MARRSVLYFILLNALINKGQACFCDHYAWTQWTSCSKTCNSGTQSRHRQIVVDKYYQENFCEQICSKQETRECNWQRCPINCLLGDFGPWSDCDPCIEKQSKVRSVLRPSQFGGQPCTAPLVAFQPCIPSKLCKIEEADCKNKFRCDSGRCIARKLECNGENDCGDNSDERDCGRTKAVCTRKYNPIPSVQLMGNGFHFLAGEPRGEVLDNSFTGGICKTVKSSRTSNPYRVPANLENVGFEVQTAEDDLKTDFYKDLTSLGHNENQQGSFSSQGGSSFSVPIFYSSKRSENINHNSAFKQAIQASHKKDSSFIRIHKVMKVLNFTTKAKDLHLSDVFLKALNHLPLEYNSALYSRIFDDFGTHYFTSGSLGGVYDLLYQFSSEELKNSGLTEEEAKHCVRIETKKRVLFAKKTKVEHRCTTNKLSEKHEGSFIQGAEKSISLIRGGRSEYGAALAWEKGSSGLEEKTFSEWLESVKENPAVIDFELAPIVDLVRNIPCAVTKRNNLRKALQEYAAKFDPCQCAPCPNNGRPTLSGTECLCVCQSGTYGENCEKQSPDYKSSLWEQSLKGNQAMCQAPCTDAVDGQWGCWSSWSTCDATYKRSRTRECNNPAPQRGGKRCEGEKRQEEDCTFSIMENNGQPCINDDEEMKEVDLPEIEADSGCPQPVPPENGFIRNEKQLYLVGEDVEISCLTGFETVGYQYFRCLPDGTWRQGDVECQRTECIKPVVQEVLTITPFQRLYRIGESIELTCPKGFVVAGPSRYTCQGNSWTPPISNSLTCEKDTLTKLKGHCQLGQKQSGSECICMSPEEDCRNACFPLLGSHHSEDLCVFDTDSNDYFTSPACKFLAEKCLNNQQLHFLHIGSCQDGRQLEWGLERTRLSSNSTKKESCGYDTCYDWEKCSASTSKCVCLLPPQCFKGGNQLYCVKMGSSTSEKTLNICEVGTIRCANRKMEILHPGKCLA
ncbi:complement component C6 isoform X2 [Homo sapiens]|nr:complement component C6 isoform X2 [Homo sapiens]XP_011512418.1 complement component C6 isoform X2 [Homo sapiens]XP_011512419.1 complement component C6 isoform X2 [Homo sapiens]XP_011512420.1 complement component C6 isoform X2 [Homo sapiens]XP_016865307.1 complement component C6 isoform X2 [Homo sapiens]XP_047273643.1 complement component C6 isoform X2 [Homo sapiens]XP_047273644.1 complement component C6 isoform X2 [Homo sapiens]XP_054209391.1 complement component C6 isoform X2 [Homo sapi|eukprot:XP_011512417.1 complement component C6 isoform X3 [Homo sapiens]